MQQSEEEGVTGGEVKGGDGGGGKGLLSLWREKVFALLVQSRLQQMQHSRDTEEAQHRVSDYSTPLANSYKPISAQFLHVLVVQYLHFSGLA